MRRSPIPSWPSIPRSYGSPSGSRPPTTSSTTSARRSTLFDALRRDPCDRYAPCGGEVHVKRRSWLGQPSAVGRAVTIPLTGVAFYLLHRWGAIAGIPLWKLYLILGLAGVASVLAERRWP